jgi:hypothetical protein
VQRKFAGSLYVQRGYCTACNYIFAFDAVFISSAFKVYDFQSFYFYPLWHGICLILKKFGSGQWRREFIRALQ